MSRGAPSLRRRSGSASRSGQARRCPRRACRFRERMRPMDERSKIEIQPLVDQATLKEALNNGKEALTRDALGPLSHLSWDLVRSTLAKGLEDGLGAGLLTSLAKGWSVAREIHELQDEQGYGCKQARYMPGPHETTFALHPPVTISCG